jgi:Fe2+ transport system protein FeoA
MFIYKPNQNKMTGQTEKTRLTDIDDGKIAVIVSIVGGKALTKRLADLGFTEGTEIRILRRTLFTGPVQVEVCGSKLVLGRGLASKIFVELK